MLRLVIINIFLLGATQLVAQKFYTEVSSTNIEMGDNLRVSFTLDNMNGGNLTPPPFKDFDIVGGPNLSTRSSSINGRRTSQQSIVYTVSPKRPGQLKIQAASAIYRGKEIFTQPVTINVAKGLTSNLPLDDQVFLKGEVTDSIIFIGQQIILEYKIYTLGNASSPNFRSVPSFDGFFTQNLPLGKKTVLQETINGQKYNVQTFAKVAMFPQQTGTYEIEPVQVTFRMEAITPQGKRVISKSETIAGIPIQVRDLPSHSEPKTGAVGRYRMQVKCDQRSINTDQAIVVNMFIAGNGDPNQIKPPRWNLPDGLEMYDPNISDGQPQQSAYGLSHNNGYEYLIVAKKPGRYSLTPSFTYYNTDSSAYVTLKKSLPPIRVTQGTNLEEVAAPQAQKEIANIYESFTPAKPSGSLHHSLIHLGSFLSLLLGGIGMFFYAQRLEKSGKFDERTIKKNKAYSIAQKRLQKSKEALSNQDAKLFHEEMILALKTYLTDKYEIPALHIKKPELYAQLEPLLNETSFADLKTIIDRSEVAMYAPSSSSDMNNTYQLATDLIASLEA